MLLKSFWSAMGSMGPSVLALLWRPFLFFSSTSGVLVGSLRPFADIGDSCVMDFCSSSRRHFVWKDDLLAGPARSRILTRYVMPGLENMQVSALGGMMEPGHRCRLGEVNVQIVFMITDSVQF